MIRTAESVSPRHPDKICDQISDAVLDECLRRDPNARVAIEVMGGHGEVVIMGEITMNDPDTEPSWRPLSDLITEIVSLLAPGTRLQTNIVQQSAEIANGVDRGGAGDQGIMVGYACNETPEKMPLEVMLARELNKFIFKRYPFDGKTQVTIDDEGGRNDIVSIVASFQNVPAGLLESLVKDWLREKFGKVFSEIEILANPAGDWQQGGFDADTGLTGRKLMVDNYGPRVPVGGGCFSGKDATKVDRSAAYMARYLAVYYLEKFGCQEVIVYLAYAIGRADPLQATVIADGNMKMVYPVESIHDLTPKGIINFLDLKKPQFQKTAEWGHFGNGFPWDKA